MCFHSRWFRQNVYMLPVFASRGKAHGVDFVLGDITGVTISIVGHAVNSPSSAVAVGVQLATGGPSVMLSRIHPAGE